MAKARNELKFSLHAASAFLLERRLSVGMRKDPYAGPNASYHIRSLYFEDPASSAYLDKVDGLENRTKYRIRFYNGDLSYIRLEKKQKIGKKSFKYGEVISPHFARDLISAKADRLAPCGPLSEELICKISFERFRPLLFVDYQRVALLHPVGYIRVTLDHAVTGSLFRGELEKSQFYVPVMEENETVLEIKYDSLYPTHVCDMLADIPKIPVAYSKFCKCRAVLI